jgi:ribosome-associated toxin RatA of RatAB toxin-antitoxin module
MARVEEQAIIPAPVDQVFDLIADHRRALEWLEGFTRFEHVKGPERGLGARVLTEGRMLGFFRIDNARNHRI